MTTTTSNKRVRYKAVDGFKDDTAEIVADPQTGRALGLTRGGHVFPINPLDCILELVGATNAYEWLEACVKRGLYTRQEFQLEEGPKPAPFGPRHLRWQGSIGAGAHLPFSR